MNRLSILYLSIALLLSGVFGGCYDDKGNYDYHDINTMTVSVLAKNQNGKEMAIGEGGLCRYKQPSSTDTLWVTYTPEVKQSELKDETNLEYCWKVSYTKDDEYVLDTVLTKELTLVFPPQQTTTYSVIFSVTDNSTNISFYQSLQISTVKPYINSWLVLNGEKDNRRISAVEDPDSTNYILTADAYMDLGYERRFQQAIDLVYSPSFLPASAGSEVEALQIIEPDSIFLMSPFDMQVVSATNQLLPSVILANSRKLLYGLDGNVQNGNTILVDDSRKIYYAGRDNNTYQEFYSEDIPHFRVDKIGQNNESSYICFWDNEQKQFMYADQTKGTAEAFSEDMSKENIEVVWMGADNKHDKEAWGCALVKNLTTGEFWLYHFANNNITKENIGILPIDENSQFAVAPMEFDGQLFYTAGSVLYRFFVDGRESFELYDAKAPITQLQFRTSQQHNLDSEYSWMYRCLGIVVDKGTEGELHEIKLDNSGDRESVNVFTGFGPIQDICFTFVNRKVS